MPKPRLGVALGCAAGLALAGALAPRAQQNFDKVEIKTERLTDHIYVLKGAGGNIGLCVGEDGTFLIDDQFAPLTARIKAAVAAVTDRPVRFVLNTHWHGDHVGGNENLGKAGAVIVAQENVRKRLSVDQISNRGGAFIDLSTGGSVDGMIAACDQVLAMVGEKTKIIPGHGPLSDRVGLKTFRDMLAASRERVRQAIAQGKTLEQAKAAKLTADYDAAWGGSRFMPPERFVEELYKDLSRKPGSASGSK